MGLAPTPAIPVDTLMQQFVRAVDAFELHPTPERLRELERLATQLMARLRQLGPAALALLRASVARVVVVLASPTVVVWGGAIVGAGLFWWGFFTLLSENIKLPDPGELADQVIWILQLELGLWGVGVTGERVARCWELFREELIDLINRAGGTRVVMGSPEWLNKYKLILARLLRCLLSGLGELTQSMRDKLADLLQKMLTAGGFLAALGVAAGTAEAGEPDGPALDDPEVAEAVKRLGLTGIPRGDGFGHCETLPPEEMEDTPAEEAEKQPCDPMPWDVELRVDLPLTGFSDADLKKRKAILECWIAYYEGLVRDDRAAVRERDGDTDTAREDLLRLRLQVNRRELERLRRAKQNVDRECQVRALRRTPGEMAPPLETRLRFRWPEWGHILPW